MTSEQSYGVLREVRRAALLSDHGELTDGQLIQRFLDQRDEAAFELLLRRHGPMILGVCRRLLHNAADAEDAFQAVFVVLVRKAAAFRTRRTIGDWLYGVAYHTALKARAATVKRRFKESQVRPSLSVEQGDGLTDVLPLLDKELARLPAKYREPVVLCELQGRGRRETARQLGIPEGTLSSRLATARKLLANRLGRYGLAITGGTLAVLLTPKMATAHVTPALAASTLEAVMAGATAPVVALAEGVLKAMAMTKWKVLTVVVLVFGLALGGAAVRHAFTLSEARAADEKPKPKEEAKADATAVKRGEYLVTVVARCGDCHTPRNDKGELVMARHLQGAKVWFTPKVKPKEWEGEAPDITMAGKAGKWSEEVMVTYLTTGLTAKGKQAKAPMPAYKMAPEDAKAVTAYLRSLSGDKKGGDKKDEDEKKTDKKDDDKKKEKKDDDKKKEKKDDDKTRKEKEDD